MLSLRALLVAVPFVLGTLLASPAIAVPISWSLVGVTFDDGGTASGSFTTDSTSGALLTYDIVTTAGSTLGGFHYDGVGDHKLGDNVFSLNSFLIVEDGFLTYINLAFANPLTAAGVDPLVTSGFTAGSWECNNCTPVRFVTAGFAQAPEPLTLALVGLGLLGMGFSRRKTA